MGWLSQNKVITASAEERFNRAGTELGEAWSFFAGTDDTDAQIFGSDEVHQPSGAGAAPAAFYQSGLLAGIGGVPGEYRDSFRVSATYRFGDPTLTVGTNLILFARAVELNPAVNRGGFYNLRLFFEDSAEGSANELELNNRFGPLDSIIYDGDATGFIEQSYYRIGIEVMEGKVRGYITPGTLADPTLAPAALNALMEPRVEGNSHGSEWPPADWSLFDPLVSGPSYIVFGFSINSISNATATTRAGLDDFLIEGWDPPLPPYSASPPGTQFQLAESDPYAFYKTSLALRDLLVNVQVEA